ncbi:MAG: thiamine phosphate synthase [Gammaproteobacteria bacterium]|nr:thiamine phosphate synthase [Gammaproteobacteria bacterium]MBU1441448.1 thiamine phosphate synthase [Gammaproteobacteria bacterium]MBU2285562.1 thiamine phosphate synthase [Gammaproteobacteria bacterium]
MTDLTDPRAIAQAIFSAHADRFGQTTDGPSAAPNSGDAVYVGARQACSTLGFIDVDAECLAGAWQAQTRRIGHFDPRAWPDQPADFGMRDFPPTARADAFPTCPERLGLYAVLPDAAWVGRMARAGVPTVQLRFKSDDAQAIAAEIAAAVAAVQNTTALLFINDHWRTAIGAGAYGIHLGQEDLDALSPDELEALRASGLRLGVSTHGYAEMVRADAVSPSYIAMGAVYPTTLKQMATAPQGVARLAAYARLMRGYPQVGIGGVDAERLPDVLATGVGSVAVVRALVAAPDPEAAAAHLLSLMAHPKGPESHAII